MRNEGIYASQHTASKAGKRTKGREHATRGGNDPKSRGQAPKARPPATSGHDEGRQAEPQPAPTLRPLPKICLDFAVRCLAKYEGKTKPTKEMFIFAPFC